jgi:predicted AlkP superfamily phosphohydrolase/phosphomutase
VGTSRQKVIVFGLDGGTFDMIDPLMEKGHLPNLARLMGRGAWGELESTIPAMTGPAWTSFMTGKNPGKHGIYAFHESRPGAYDQPIATSGSIMAPTIWDIAGSRGRRSIVIDVPMTYPAGRIEGLMIATFLAPSREAKITTPPQLHAELVAHVGHFPFEDEVVPLYGRSDRGSTEILEQILHGVRRKMETAQYLLKRYDWDLAIVVFRATDIVQHGAWKFWDEEYRRAYPEEALRFGSVIPVTYRAVDRALGKIIDDVGGDASIVVMSDHGAGPIKRYFFANAWLMDEGLLRRRRINVVNRYRWRRTRHTVREILPRFHLARAARFLPRSVGRLRPWLPRRRRDRFASVDWRHTLAYSPLETGCSGSIILNVAGREPSGIIKPGEEYEQVRDMIIGKLRQLRKEGNGEPVMELVCRREDLYSGPYLQDAPDIIYMPRGLEYVPRGDLVEGPIFRRPPFRHSSTHRMNGMVIVAGPMTKANERLEGARILDIAPTVLYLMGLPLLDDMDGHVLTDAFADDYLNARPPVVEEAAGLAGPRGESADSYSDEEERRVDEILKGLGYVG